MCTIYTGGQKTAQSSSRAGYLISTTNKYSSSHNPKGYTALNYGRVESEIVIPGLDSNYYSNDSAKRSTGGLVPQGLTYWASKGWFLVSAYHDNYTRSGSGTSAALVAEVDYSCYIFAIKASTGKVVAKFNIKDTNGSTNLFVKSGGIAVSKNNLYLTCEKPGDSAFDKLGYIPLSSLNVSEDTRKDVAIGGTVNIGTIFVGSPKASLPVQRSATPKTADLTRFRNMPAKKHLHTENCVKNFH